MKRTKKIKSVASKTSAMALALIMMGMATVGLLGFFMNRSDILKMKSEQALSIAQSVEPLVDAQEMSAAMSSLQANAYTEKLGVYLDSIKLNTGAAYIYILDKDANGDWRYFAEGQLPDEPDSNVGTLGDVEGEGVFDAMADETYSTGENTVTDIYNSDGYGYLVSGYVPVKNGSGQTIGVIGADIHADEVNQASAIFGLLMCVIVAAFCVVCAIIFRRYVNKNVGVPVEQLALASTKIAKGDMDVEVKYTSDDEIGTLSRSFQSMVESTRNQVRLLENIADGDLTVMPKARSKQDSMSMAMQKTVLNLRKIVGQISIGTREVMSGSQQVAGGATTLAQGSIEQTSAVNELSRFIGDVADKTKQNTEKAESAAGLTLNIRQSAENGSRQMEELLRAVEDINEASASINKIMKVIDDISFQTNILALNAAVEAARAGENGKGFSIVADEVRNLAAKSAQAAKESSALISNSISKAEEGARIARVTSESLADIVRGINESADIIHEIASSSVAQNTEIDQINAGIENVNQVVRLNSDTAQQSAAASQQMSGQAQMLNELVSAFRVKDAE